MTSPWPCRPEEIFPHCKKYLAPEIWGKIASTTSPVSSPEQFPEYLTDLPTKHDLPLFLIDLARLEFLLFQVSKENNIQFPAVVEKVIVNPSLHLLQLSHSNVLTLLEGDVENTKDALSRQPEFILVWTDPVQKKVRKKAASERDLLALKIVTEELNIDRIAADSNSAVGIIDSAIDSAVDQGILLQPESKLKRGADFPRGENIEERYFSSPVFTLQFHITQACDLHCRHCYDRTNRATLPLEKGIAILDDFRTFCRERYVSGQISFTGGNPLLHPQFLELYQAATDRNLLTAILGNPCSQEKIEEICAIQHPAFYQVSLEGMAEHNDYIRGEGHFERVISFLEILKKLNVYSMVMLTLTKANMEQVLPLADYLRGKVDLFTYNRLAMVGEGAQLLSVDQEEYKQFLEKYMQAAQSNPVMSLKDNLLNLARHKSGQPLFGGCAGHGCGAAFNFLAALPDGEVHACRKLPSLVGNMFDQTIAEIYDSEAAQQYRNGTSSCSSCKIRPVCGGCPAVVYGFGLDVFKDRDPYCFIDC
jgi:selenobiotic family peptide radical SAM maturase